MKIEVMMKTPDALYYAFQDLPPDIGMQAKQVTDKFFRYDEIVTLEIDTEEQTITVKAK